MKTVEQSFYELSKAWMKFMEILAEESHLDKFVNWLAKKLNNFSNK